MIEHDGVVERVGPGMVCVKITSHSACGACRAREACGLAEAQEKIVEVHTPEAQRYAPGDAVKVGVRRSTGGIAVALAYGGSLVVLLAVLVGTVVGLEWSEGRSVLATLLAVGGYYFVLWLFRRKIEHTIQFTITKN